MQLAAIKEHLGFLDHWTSAAPYFPAEPSCIRSKLGVLSHLQQFDTNPNDRNQTAQPWWIKVSHGLVRQWQQWQDVTAADSEKIKPKRGSTYRREINIFKSWQKVRKLWQTNMLQNEPFSLLVLTSNPPSNHPMRSTETRAWWRYDVGSSCEAC